MKDFPGNSHKTSVPPEPREKMKAVTTATTVRRKRNLGRQFKETFFKGDPRGAAEYVFFEVLVPSVKDMLFDGFESGIRSLIYGEDAKKRPSGASAGYAGLGHVAYNSMSSAAKTVQSERVISRRARARHDFGELVIASREEAENVLDLMFETLSRYGSVSVATLYELTGIQSSHTDMKWGWTELQGSKAVRTRQGGFLLDLPAPVELSG